MAKAKGVYLNIQSLRGLLTDRGWTQATLADKASVALRTVTKIFQGDTVSLDTLTAIASALGVTNATLLPTETRIRRIHGLWAGFACDLETPSNQYGIKPVHYRFQMTVTQTDRTFTALGELIGQLGVPQKFEARGSLKEDGNFVQMEWWNAEEGVHDYGTALLKLNPLGGKQLDGWYVGREQNHGTSLILGEIHAERAPAAP